MIEIIQPFLTSYIFILLILCMFIGLSIYAHKRRTIFKIFIIFLGILSIGISIHLLSDMLGKSKPVTLELLIKENPQIIRYVIDKKEKYIYYIFKFKDKKELVFFNEVYTEKKAKELAKKGREANRGGGKLFYSFDDYLQESGRKYHVQPQKRALPEKYQGKING